MSTNRNPLTQIPIRAARWSATHPWRAMLSWLVFVLVAVGLAVAVPTTETKDSDYRMGESGHADAFVHDAGLEAPQTENVLINPRGHAALDSVAAMSAADEIRDGMRGVAGVEKVSQAQPNADRSALLISIQLARDQDDVSALQSVTKRVQADHPDLQVREAGDVSIDSSINDRVGSRPRFRRGHQPAGHTGPDAAGVRRADRRRHPGAAGRHQRRRHDRHHRAALAPRARGVHGEQHDRADRDGRRGRLLAVLPQARARGTRARAQHPRRRRDRRADLGPLDPGLRRSGDRLDGGPVRHRRRDLQLAGHRRRSSSSPSRSSARSRCCPRCWSSSVAGSTGRGCRCCGASTAASAAAGSAAASSARSLRHPVVALAVSGVVVLLLAVPAVGMRIHSGNLQTLPAAIPEVQTYARITQAFPSEGTTADRRRQGRRADQRPRSARRCAKLEPRGDRRPATSRRRAATPSRSRRTARTVGAARSACRTTSRTRRSTERSPRCATDLVPAALGGLHAEHAVGRRRGRVPGLRQPAARPAADRHRLRAAADAADDGPRVPQRHRSR